MPESTRADYIKGLRALADILDAHSEVPLPYQGQPECVAMTFHFLSSDDPRAEMAATRRALGVNFAKDADDRYFDLDGRLHGLAVKLVAFREAVCERVVVGKREIEVEEPDPEALALVPTIKRTEVVEDVEWQCHPILADSTDEQPAMVTA